MSEETSREPHELLYPSDQPTPKPGRAEEIWGGRLTNHVGISLNRGEKTIDKMCKTKRDYRSAGRSGSLRAPSEQGSPSRRRKGNPEGGRRRNSLLKEGAQVTLAKQAQ